MELIGGGILGLGRQGWLSRRAGEAWVPTYLLRDEFTTAESTPLSSPRTAEPGPGTLTVPSGASISGGALAIPTSAGFVSTYSNTTFARAVGRALTLATDAGSASVSLVYGADNGGAHYLQINNTRFRVYAGGALIRQSDIFAAQASRGALVLRSAGAHYLGRIAGTWKRLWVSSASTVTGQRMTCQEQNNAAANIDYMRVADLPAPWDTDYGTATERLAGARSAGNTFAHEANTLVEFTATTLPSAGYIDLFFRYQDDNNTWVAEVAADGTFELWEVVGGVWASRGATAAGVVTNGTRVVILADGTTIVGYSGNTERWSYSSASNFQSETSGELDTLGTGGAVSDIVSWPRTISGAALTYLEAL